MSFDLLLTTFRNGGPAAADAAAARRVLERTRYVHRPKFDAYDINFEDGSHVQMFAGGLHGGDKPFDGAMFAMRGFSEAIGTFIFEFSRAAGCVIIPALGPSCVLLPREDQAAHLPAKVSECLQQIPIANGAELLAAVSGGFNAWRDYRDHVVPKSGGGPAGGT